MSSESHVHAHSHTHPTVVPATPIVRSNGDLVLTVTERAARELKAVMAAEGEKAAGLRLGVEPGGCAGYQYALSLAQTPEPGEVVAESGGVKVFVARENVAVLNGLTVDFVDTAMGSGFNIKNPNARHTCGCGNTFDA